MDATVDGVCHDHLHHLRELVREGASALTPVLLIAAVWAALVPLVALVIVLVEGSAHFG